VVYACYGCSNAGLATDIAVVLDRESIAEMASIAGLRTNYLPAVHKAITSDCIIAIDGCWRSCASSALAEHGLIPTHYIKLHQLPVRSSEHQSSVLGESYHALCFVYEVLGVVDGGLRDWRVNKRANG
jgi:uncharacterized metal-binding protein